MTMAVCFNCGEIKFGAFCLCDKCGQGPKTEDDRIISMAMTDHYFDKAGLEQISESTKKYGSPPALAPENREQIRQLLQECEPMIPEIGKMLVEKMKQTTQKKPWWKFW